jgi:hypothetical protein
MHIELLTFVVYPPTTVEDFITADRNIWNPWLQRQLGFLHKTVTVHDKGETIDLRIFWKDKRCREIASQSLDIPYLEATLRHTLQGQYHLVRSL